MTFYIGPAFACRQRKKTFEDVSHIACEPCAVLFPKHREPKARFCMLCGQPLTEKSLPKDMTVGVWFPDFYSVEREEQGEDVEYFFPTQSYDEYSLTKTLTPEILLTDGFEEEYAEVAKSLREEFGSVEVKPIVYTNDP